MVIDVSNISNTIFKILKAHGLQLVLFTVDGKPTLNPSEATRFYSKNKNIMVNLDNNTDKKVIKVSTGGSVDLKSIRKLLDNIRNIANENAILYTLRTFGHHISPKDFAYQIDQDKNISESFSKPYGTVMTSRQKFENATLYIRHSKRVDEETRGSRSRNIHAIFVENSNGERFKFPYNNIVAARAMTVHISEGGTPYDTIGKTIISLTEEICSLKNFKKKNKTLAESSKLLFNSISDRIHNITKQFSQMSNHKGYRRNVAEFVERNDVEVDEAIFEQFGIQFEENDNKTFVYNIAKQLKEDADNASALQDFVKRILNGEKVEVSRMPSNSDTKNPIHMHFDDENSELSAWFGYFALLANDDVQSNTLSQLSDDVFSYSNKYRDLAKKLLTALQDGAIVPISAKPEGLLESISTQMEKTLSSYGEI